MRVALGPEHEAAFLQDTDQRFVGILEEHAGDRLNLREKISVTAHCVDNRQTMRFTQPQVIDAISRRRVDNTRSRFGANEPGTDDAEGIAVDLEKVEQSVITHTHQFGALDPPDNLVCLVAHDIVEKSFGQDQCFPFGLDPGVINVVVDREQQIGRQRPRRRRPDQQECVFFPGHRKANKNGWVLDFPIAEREFMRGKGCTDTRIKGYDLVSAVN